MDATLEQHILETLKAKFGDDITGFEKDYDFPVYFFNKEKNTDIIRFLKEDEGMGFGFLTTMCGIHYPETKQICVMYQLHNLPKNLRIRLKTFLPEDNAEIDTITGIFKGANWMEREGFDFFGIRFKGHPDLRRILNVEDMIMHPLRKEFPLEDQTRKDKNDSMFGR